MSDLDPHYTNPRLAGLYDFDSGWSVDRDFYVSLADSSGQTTLDILDLGCGTGLICDALAARGHRVTGLDPAASMLEIARRKPHADSIEWVQARVQDYVSERRFDLIIMTGHAFQVLLDESDLESAFAVMRNHLKPGGLIAFESRNPDIDWARRWDYTTRLELPEGPVQESRRFLQLGHGLMHFELGYQFADEQLVTPSKLRFWSRLAIEAQLTAAGLRVENLFGDWQGQVFEPAVSEEMIFLVRHSR